MNDVKLFAMNPDCTQMVAIAGQHGKPGNSLVQFEELREGEYVGIVTSRERTIQSGALLYVDARSNDSTTGIAIDEEGARYSILTPEVPVDEESPRSGVGRYRRPFPLPGGENLLVSWANGDVNDRNELAGTAPNFGIYMWNAETGQRSLVYDDGGMWDLYATPLVPRTAPPTFPGVTSPQPVESLPTTFGSVDVTVTSLTDIVSGGALDGMSLGAALVEAATKVRIIEGFSSEIGPVRQFGLTMHEGAAILGEATVHSDGSWEAEVPSRIPYHLQVLDQYGMAIRSEGLWIQSMPGEHNQCGGCHEARDEVVRPRVGASTIAQQQGPDDFVTDLSNPLDRMEIPWAGGVTPAGGQPPAPGRDNVQEIFDAHCVNCHSPGGGGTDPFAGRFYTADVTMDDGTVSNYQIPYLDLSSTPLTVYYDMEVVTYPVSYISLLYPSVAMMDATLTGTVPPTWVEPASARTSRLIQKINITAEGDPLDWAFDGEPGASSPGHPEDVGVNSLTREERLMLIRMADLGGQYYSRRNVPGDFTPYVPPSY